MNLEEVLMADYVVEWILDTGTSNAVINAPEIRDATRIEKASKPKRAMSANGIITFDQILETRVPLLGRSFQAYVLPNTANALALGRLCTEFGYSFWWGAFRKEPKLWDKSGRDVPIYVRNFVPYVSNQVPEDTDVTMAAASDDPYGSDHVLGGEPVAA